MAIETRLTKYLNQKKWIIIVLFAMMCFYFVGTVVACEIRHLDTILPTFAFSIGGELSALFVAVMLTVSILPTYKRQSGYIRIFVTLLTIGCSCCFLDACQMLVDGVPELAMLNKVLCVFVFLNEVIFIYFFWLYATYVLGISGGIMKTINVLILVGLAIFLLVPFVNFFYPLYFSIDANGVYARNTDTWWIARIYFVLVAISIFATVFLSKAPRKSKLLISLFIIIPIVCVGVGGYKYGISILYTSMIASLVLIYSFLFSDNEKALYSTNKELGLATNIQKHMLPSIFPAFPERKEFDIYALMDPAKEVGGDFYDFFLIDDTHLGIVIADVSDKGVPAALFMMASKIMVQNYALMGFSPKEVLTRVNQQICSNNQEEMFVTVWLGVLDLKTGTIVASNAGHERPIIKKPDGNYEVMDDKHGFVVGWYAQSVYTEYTIQLEKGSKLFLYTDGVPEAKNKSERFGMNRTVEALNKYKDLPVDQISKNLLNDIYSFMGNINQFDDITMLCLEYRGYDNKDEGHHLTIKAEKKEIPNGINPIVSFLEESGADKKITYKIKVAIEEILTNVASYAYAPNTGDIDIRYRLLEDGNVIEITVEDSGVEFDPLKAQDPDTTLPLEERQIGGLGIFIVKKTMDDIKYERKNNKNILVMKKAIK